jgi:hypothetical protein
VVHVGALGDCLLGHNEDNHGHKYCQHVEVQILTLLVQIVEIYEEQKQADWQYIAVYDIYKL